MTHTGPEPPWEGESRYGSWSSQELWDGRTLWTWRPPARPSLLAKMSAILVEHYLPAIKDLYR